MNRNYESNASALGVRGKISAGCRVIAWDLPNISCRVRGKEEEGKRMGK